MRRKLLLLVVVALCGIAYADEWKKEFTVGPKPELRVSTNDARIEVRRGGDKIEAGVWTEGWKIGAGGVKIYDRQSGDQVSIDVQIPSGLVFSFHNKSVHVILNVPVNTTLDLHSGDGSLVVTGIEAPARLSTGDGRIEVWNFSGPLHAKTSDGSIQVRGRFDDLSLESGDRRIECEIQPGSKMRNRWIVRTSDGSIDLRLPPDLAANLEARTGDGRLEVDFPMTVQGNSSDDSRHQIQARLNGGGNILDVHTGDGSVRIHR